MSRCQISCSVKLTAFISFFIQKYCLVLRLEVKIFVEKGDNMVTKIRRIANSLADVLIGIITTQDGVREIQLLCCSVVGKPRAACSEGARVTYNGFKVLKNAIQSGFSILFPCAVTQKNPSACKYTCKAKGAFSLLPFTDPSETAHGPGKFTGRKQKVAVPLVNVTGLTD